MGWYLNQRVGKKLAIAFGFKILLLVIIFITSYSVLSTIVNENSQLYRRDLVAVNDLNIYAEKENAIRLALVNMILSESESERVLWLSDLKHQSDGIEHMYPRLKKLLSDTPESANKLDTLNKIRLENKDTRDNHVVPLLLSGKISEAKKLEPIQAQRFNSIRQITDELIKEEQARANASVNRVQEKSIIAKEIIIGLCLLSLSASIWLSWYLNRIISEPLKKISTAAEQIALGNLKVEMPLINRSDEIGVLSDTFSSMIVSLQEISEAAVKIADGDLTVKVNILSEKDVLSKSILAMVEKFRNINIELNEAVDKLSSAASDISLSTTQLVASASETATSVAETTTAIEEIRQTAQQANQKANAVTENVQITEKIYESGKKASEEASEGIRLIHRQMEFIAKSMQVLSEQTQTISGLISVVDDLAQQSNLLAVNASIEAAKAGEQGRGFSVVAQEVKSLADQSKQATHQVRTILGDIQKATSSAVMATEEGAKVVQDGIKKSNEARNSIMSLASSIAESAQTAAQISAASHQQLIGMEQSTSAMENIKESSFQNANSAKKLEFSTQVLSDLGHKLQKFIGMFRLR